MFYSRGSRENSRRPHLNVGTSPTWVETNRGLNGEMDKYQIKISTRQQNVDSKHVIGPAARCETFSVTPNRRGAALHARVTGRAWTERGRHSPGDVHDRAGHRAEGTAHPIRRFQTRRASEHPSISDARSASVSTFRREIFFLRHGRRETRDAFERRL